jgi:serine phosphatase RsbU (regulator of sigma subunit)
MLPKKIPPIPNLDIAVFMKPATEVGGDYYDFKYNNNGNPDVTGTGLTIAVGDATGHGMKAGTLVATIKGLFTAEPAQTDILSFFSKCNSMIRDMQLGNLYMAMMIAKIDGDKMIISSAGMPPALIYRGKTKQVEEIRIQGLPLGGSSDSRYVKKETSLFSGDTLLLMSDGFPELFNKEKEILDYHKAKEIFCSVAELPSKKIVEELNYAAEKWMDGANQQDDITFVVVKVK